MAAFVEGAEKQNDERESNLGIIISAHSLLASSWNSVAQTSFQGDYFDPNTATHMMHYEGKH